MFSWMIIFLLWLIICFYIKYYESYCLFLVVQIYMGLSNTEVEKLFQEAMSKVTQSETNE